MEGFLTTRQVADLAGISVGAVNRLAARGTLPFVWVARARMFRKEKVQAWLNDEAAQARRMMVKKP